MDAAQVGKQIAALRKERGLTQKELAELLHVTDKAVSKWERGLNFPELTLMEPLAAALNTTVIQLLSLEKATNQEVATAISAISAEERKELIRQLRFRAWHNLVVGLVLWVSLLCASKIFADHNIYGLAQMPTMGMLGFTSTLVGYEIHLLRSLPKLE